jgi:hypothetical protein
VMSDRQCSQLAVATRHDHKVAPTSTAFVVASLDEGRPTERGLLLICCWKRANRAPGRPDVAGDLWWS